MPDMLCVFGQCPVGGKYTAEAMLQSDILFQTMESA
jgi:hypothetical protein